MPETLFDPATAHADVRHGASPAARAALAPTRDETPLRLRVDGLADDERNVLIAILNVLEERTERRWQLSDQLPPDLHLHTRASECVPRPGTLGGLILREGDPVVGPDVLSVSAPLRVMGVLDLLNAAHDRIVQRRLDAQGRHVATHATHDNTQVQDDGKALASVLARMVEQRLDHSLRIRIVGFGTLYLCPTVGAFSIDFPRERLHAALEQHRFVITTLPARSPEMQAQLAQGLPIQDVLWSVGLATMWEHTDIGRARFRLRRWPDLARLPHRPEHIQACAVLAAQAKDLDALARRCGLDRNEAGHLVHACHLCGLIEIVHEPAPPTTAAPPPGSGFGSLFNRLRKRFGL